MRTAQEAYEQTSTVVNAAAELALTEIDAAVDTKIKGGLFELNHPFSANWGVNVTQTVILKLTSLGYSIAQAGNNNWIISWLPNSK